MVYMSILLFFVAGCNISLLLVNIFAATYRCLIFSCMSFLCSFMNRLTSVLIEIDDSIYNAMCSLDCRGVFFWIHQTPTPHQMSAVSFLINSK